MTPWNNPMLLCSFGGFACAALLWWASRQLRKNRERRRELEGELRILKEERPVLELIARGATLSEVLTALTKAVENIVPGIMCSVLLVDQERQCLVQGAAPHLPEAYWKMCEGLPIVKDLGCCPNAAFRNQTIICEDMATDERWSSIWDAISNFGLRSCWSEPIRDSETARVIGTFAMYHSHPSKPKPFQIHAVQAGAQLAGNAIERLRAEQRLREYAGRFSLAEKAASFGIWEWDPVTGLFELSDGTALMSGFGPKGRRVTAEELYATVHPDDHEPARLAREAVWQRGGSYEFEFRRVSPDGSVLWFRNVGSVQLQPGSASKVVGAILEITEQKTLLQKVERAKSAAEAAARAKTEFIANMSHEIRTPMNAVMGMTSLLLDQKLPPETLEYVDVIRTSSEALLTVINDILDFSKIESGKLDLEREPLSLPDCIEEVLELLAGGAAEKEIELAGHLDLQLGDWIYGDVTRLRQILLNLVGNAIKFTTEGAVSVSVGVRSTEQGEKLLHFSVQDTGVGIPAAKIDHLFQSFTQVDASTTRRFGGTGLGLVISKRLTDLMGGKIWVTSQLGIGSVFQFEIPYEAAPAQQAPLVGAKEWQGQAILSVVGNSLNSLALQSTLQRWGLHYANESSGAAALAALRRQSWSAVLVDSKVEEIKGSELALAIKREFGDSAPPVILLSSAAASINSQLENSLHTADFLLPKPVRRQRLHRVLMQVLGGATQGESASKEKLFDESFASQYPLRILLAEDNPVNQKMVVRLLAKLGYLIDAAGDGLEALQALHRQSYDLVLMDVHMPQIDGLQATRQIVSTWGSERPWIAALTAGAMKENRDECLAAGFDDFLTKPMNIQRLKETLQRASARSRMRLEQGSADLHLSAENAEVLSP